MKSDNYFTNFLLEKLRDQLKAAIKISTDTRNKVLNLPRREEFEDLRKDVRIIKLDVTETNKQFHNHKIPITKLESKTA